MWMQGESKVCVLTGWLSPTATLRWDEWGGIPQLPPDHCQREDSIFVFWRGRASLELCSLFQDQNRRLVGSCHGFQQSSSGNPQHAHLDLGGGLQPQLSV